MSCVKDSNNKSTELLLISAFKKNSISGWRRKYKIVGKPDFVFPKTRVIVFVDGCFWHGCKKHFRLPKTNQLYWSNKIQRNCLRDKAVTRIFFRIWEHELKGNVLSKRIMQINGGRR